MPFRWFKCTKCQEEFRSRQEKPFHCDVEESEVLLSAPSTKFMELKDPERGKSSIVNQDKILKERARNHSRDNELDDLIGSNDKETISKNGWLNDRGTKRKAIDDI